MNFDVKSEKIRENTSENSRSFDPDKRVEQVEINTMEQKEERFNPDKRIEVDDAPEVYSTREQRINKTPKEDCDFGKWEGERGDSKFVPNKEEVQKELSKFDKDGVNYTDGKAEFQECSYATVEIDNMTSNREKNFDQADMKCAEQWNNIQFEGKSDWTAREVKEWRKNEDHLSSWHENNDMKTCHLVPRVIHDTCIHFGGVGECKIRESVNNLGGEFDE